MKHKNKFTHKFFGKGEREGKGEGGRHTQTEYKRKANKMSETNDFATAGGKTCHQFSKIVNILHEQGSAFDSRMDTYRFRNKRITIKYLHKMYRNAYIYIYIYIYCSLAFHLHRKRILV